MKSISLHELKTNLSALIAEVEAGERLRVTRYRRPVAEIGPAESTDGLHVGSEFGRWRPRSLELGATGGYYLEVLEEDRGEG